MGSSHRLLAAVRRRTPIEKTVVARASVDHLRAPRRGPIAPAVVRCAGIRPALDYLARAADARLRRIAAVTVSPKTRHETPEAGKRRCREAVPRLDSRAERALCYPC